MGNWTTSPPTVDGYYPAVLKGRSMPCMLEVYIIRDDEAEITSRGLMRLGFGGDYGCSERSVALWYSEPLPVIQGS